MIIMVINSGSSSLKYQLFDMESSSVLAKGLAERIGIDGRIKHELPIKTVQDITINTHEDAIKAVIEHLTGSGVLGSLSDISAVGHRVCHGGDYIIDAALIDEGVKEAIRKCIKIAPLHNPAVLVGIEACENVLDPLTPHVGVCDTAFHQTMPREAYTFAIPYELAKKHKLRRYGFHGMSHRYVSEEAAKFLGKPLDELNIITCHLGNGSTLAAIKKGKSIDTTSGFTSLEGLVMGTRCGDTDTGAVTYLMHEENLSPGEIEDMLYRKSGVLGLSGISPDLRDIERRAEEGDDRAMLTLEVLSYRIKKYIGAYIAALGGVDAIVFTAGIGENSDIVRGMALSNLERLGIILDVEKNKRCRGRVEIISSAESKVQVIVMPTNEEWVIALDTMRVISGITEL